MLHDAKQRRIVGAPPPEGVVSTYRFERVRGTAGAVPSQGDGQLLSLKAKFLPLTSKGRRNGRETHKPMPIEYYLGACDLKAATCRYYELFHQKPACSPNPSSGPRIGRLRY